MAGTLQNTEITLSQNATIDTLFELFEALCEACKVNLRGEMESKYGSEIASNIRHKVTDKRQSGWAEGVNWLRFNLGPLTSETPIYRSAQDVACVIIQYMGRLTGMLNLLEYKVSDMIDIRNEDPIEYERHKKRCTDVVAMYVKHGASYGIPKTEIPLTQEERDQIKETLNRVSSPDDIREGVAWWVGMAYQVVEKLESSAGYGGPRVREEYQAVKTLSGLLEDSKKFSGGSPVIATLCRDLEKEMKGYLGTGRGIRP